MATPMYPIQISPATRAWDYLLKRHPCRFCHRACYRRQEYNNLANGTGETTIVYWECPKCRVEYCPGREGLVFFTVEIEDKKYSIHLTKKDTAIYQVPGTSSCCAIYQVPGTSPRFVVRFPYPLEITPQNASQKLETILTFL